MKVVIDGHLVAGDAGTYPVRNPVRPAEVVFEAPVVSAAQLDRAIAAARRAQPAWASTELSERCSSISGAADSITDTLDVGELARLLTSEHGKVLWEAQFEVATLGGMAGAFEPLARAALAGRIMEEPTARTTVTREPLGVVAAILPFNWPVAVFANKVLPALMMGNAVVVKVPPTCPGAVLGVASAFAQALPPGVVTCVCGPGPELGRSLVAHPGIDAVTLTGGTATGTAVMRAAADSVKPVILELGGNDPAIIGPDVRIDGDLGEKIIDAAFVTSGQVCMAIKRLYVPEGKKAQIVDALVSALEKQVVGDGLAPEVTMGPVHTAAARDRAESMITEASQRGAAVVRPGRLRDTDVDAGGYLVAPAIVYDVPDDTSIVRDEQFAPVLPVLGYHCVDEAFERANDAPFGLCASMWTSDPVLSSQAARALRVGTVFVNGHGIAAVDHRAPFGGWGMSGIGVELGPEGMAALSRPKVTREFTAPDPRVQ